MSLTVLGRCAHDARAASVACLQSKGLKKGLSSVKTGQSLLDRFYTPFRAFLKSARAVLGEYTIQESCKECKWTTV